MASRRMDLPSVLTTTHDLTLHEHPNADDLRHATSTLMAMAALVSDACWPSSPRGELGVKRKRKPTGDEEASCGDDSLSTLLDGLPSVAPGAGGCGAEEDPELARSLAWLGTLIAPAGRLAPAAATLMPSTASENLVMSNPQRFHTLASTVTPIGGGVASLWQIC